MRDSDIWKDIKKESPDNGEVVIAVSVNDKIPAIYTYFEPDFYFRPHGVKTLCDDYILVKEITYWMRLPAPRREE